MKNFIGIDLGGFSIKGGVFTDSGERLYSMEILTDVKRGFGPILEDISKMVFQMSESVSNCKISAVGIGIPGISEEDTGNVLFCPNLEWTDVPLGEKLREYTGLPVFVANDATVAGFAESIFGVAKGVKNSVFITLGTGIGGGIIINNNIYSGSHGAGSEIGHMIVGDNFYNCGCGRNGCLETFASGKALVKYAVHRLQNNKAGEFNTLSGYFEKGNLTAKVIFDQAKAGDRLANEAVDRFTTYLAKGILNIYDILDPDIIALGGGLSKAGDFLLLKVREKVAKDTFVKALKYGDVVLAKLGNEAGTLGAAMLASNIYKKQEKS